MIKINDAEKLEGKIKIVYNPLSELSLAMDLLCKPEHHKVHLSWASNVLDTLSLKEKEQLKYYGSLIDGYLNLDLHVDYLNYPFDAGSLITNCSTYLCNGDNWISSMDTDKMEKLTAFLSFIWDSYFIPVVKEHFPVIIEQLKSGSDLLEKSGFENFLRKVNDRISFIKKSEMRIEKWVESVFDAHDLNTFYIELSIFAFPHLVISDRHSEGSFWLTWDIPFRNDTIIAPGIERISSKAFALSDKSRLRILLMLSESPMTQKELTRQMGFAKSTISRHINILLDAGLIFSEDGERNVRLLVNKKSMERFSREILEWID